MNKPDIARARAFGSCKSSMRKVVCKALSALEATAAGTLEARYIALGAHSRSLYLEIARITQTLAGRRAEITVGG